jgi:uncharacterized protein YqhQ
MSLACATCLLLLLLLLPVLIIELVTDVLQLERVGSRLQLCQRCHGASLERLQVATTCSQASISDSTTQVMLLIHSIMLRLEINRNSFHSSI